VVVAKGPGPGWLRAALAVCAAIYFAMLMHHPEPRSIVKQIAFFTECTCLFPEADRYVIEYRLDGWSCDDRTWKPLDPRAYFPIQGDDKESRFQRIAYFYERNGRVMRALVDFVLEHHAGRDDGIAGGIGGVRISKLQRPPSPLGEPVERYHYDPLGPPHLEDERKEVYATPPGKAAQRCGQ
jgi:hypothetical protein